MIDALKKFIKREQDKLVPWGSAGIILGAILYFIYKNIVSIESLKEFLLR